MLPRILVICASLSLSVAAGYGLRRCPRSLPRAVVGFLSGLRGALIGLTISLFLATAFTEWAGARGQVPYFFATMVLGLSMLGVFFGFLTGVLSYLRA